MVSLIDFTPDIFFLCNSCLEMGHYHFWDGPLAWIYFYFTISYSITYLIMLVFPLQKENNFIRVLQLISSFFLLNKIEVYLCEFIYFFPGTVPLNLRIVYFSERWVAFRRKIYSMWSYLSLLQWSAMLTSMTLIKKIFIVTTVYQTGNILFLISSPKIYGNSSGDY